MDETAKDVRLHVTLDDGEHLFLPGEAVTLDARKADALIREGYATPLHAAAPVPAQAPKKGQRKGPVPGENAAPCGDADTPEATPESAGEDTL